MRTPQQICSFFNTEWNTRLITNGQLWKKGRRRGFRQVWNTDAAANTSDWTAFQRETEVRLAKPLLYRVSQEECEILRESVPYVKLYRYNPKHLYPKLNGYGDNGQRSLKLWQLLHTYWLPNTYWNWQEYVVSVMLISVLNIKVTCEWHKVIKLNYKNSRNYAAVAFGVPSTLHCACISSSNEVLSYRVGLSSCAVRSQMTTGRGGCIALSRLMRKSCRRTVRGNARCPHFSLVIISVTVQLWI